MVALGLVERAQLLVVLRLVRRSSPRTHTAPGRTCRRCCTGGPCGTRPTAPAARCSSRPSSRCSGRSCRSWRRRTRARAVPGSAAPIRGARRRRRCARTPRPTAGRCRCRAAVRRARPCRRPSSIAPDGLCGVLIISIRVLRRDRGAHPLPVRREGLRIQRHVHGARAGQVDRRLVAVVAGVEHDHFVARRAPRRGSRRRSPRLAPEVTVISVSASGRQP